MRIAVEGISASGTFLDELRMRVGEVLVQAGFNVAPDGLWRMFVLRLRKARDTGERAVPLTDGGDVLRAIEEFEAALPDWWFSLGSCSTSRHASCGPDREGRDAHLLRLETPLFDHGFHADLNEGGLGDALRDVMRQALEAKRARAG